MNSIPVTLAPADGAFYVETSILPGITLSEYRRARGRQARRSWLKRLLAAPAGEARA
ncbi:MAG TPA: hypothetical protein VGF25_08515 [Thermoleophilaceae bacterium]|jgi:hypothetical protein